MSDDTNTSIDTSDDLDAFSDAFFNKEAKVEAAPEVETGEVVSDTSDEDDTLATEETTEEADEVEDATPPKPKKKTAQERINDITREKHEAIRKAEDLEKRLEALERSREDNAPNKPTPTTAPVKGVPTPDDKNEDGTEKYPLGEFDPAFVRDTARFEIRHELESERTRTEESRRQAQLAEEERTLTTGWNAKVKDSNIDIVGAQEALKPLLTTLDEKFGNYLAATIMSLDKGPEVFRYLADHLDVAEDILSRGPTSATIALGRLEAKFLEETNNPPKKMVTKAPPPPPTNRGSNARHEVAADTDDLDAFSEAFFTKKKRY